MGSSLILIGDEIWGLLSSIGTASDLWNNKKGVNKKCKLKNHIKFSHQLRATPLPPDYPPSPPLGSRRLHLTKADKNMFEYKLHPQVYNHTHSAQAIEMPGKWTLQTNTSTSETFFFKAFYINTLILCIFGSVYIFLRGGHLCRKSCLKQAGRRNRKSYTLLENTGT